MKVFFIGDPLLVNGYKTSGVDAVPVTSGEELLKSLEDVLKTGNLGIVLVDHDYSSQVKDKIEQIKMKSVVPVIVEVPGRKTSADIDLKSTISRIMGVKM
ncbi:MAG: V-type ATP synthase subunit F [Candidatus Methanomethylicaceae archaeon]|jgi:vacuolar-type H+-ATPase subunit F/Vma7